METNTLKTHMKEILKRIKFLHYKDGSQVSDAQAMGILMSMYFEFDGLEILKATYEGLEDSNFHTENQTIQKLINNLK
jgi:hypothetical protein